MAVDDKKKGISTVATRIQASATWPEVLPTHLLDKRANTYVWYKQRSAIWYLQVDTVTITAAVLLGTRRWRSHCRRLRKMHDPARAIDWTVATVGPRNRNMGHNHDVLKLENAWSNLSRVDQSKPSYYIRYHPVGIAKSG